MGFILGILLGPFGILIAAIRRRRYYSEGEPNPPTRPRSRPMPPMEDEGFGGFWWGGGDDGGD